MFLSDIPVATTNTMQWFVGQGVPNTGDGSRDEKLRFALMASDWLAIRSQVLGEDLKTFDLAAHKYSIIGGQRIYFPISLWDIKLGLQTFADVMGPSNYETPAMRLQSLRNSHYQNALGVTDLCEPLEKRARASDLVERDKIERAAWGANHAQRLARTIPYAPVVIAKPYALNKLTLVEKVAGVALVAASIYAGGQIIGAVTGAIAPTAGTGAAATGAGSGFGTAGTSAGFWTSSGLATTAATTGQTAMSALQTLVASELERRGTDWVQNKAMEYIGRKLTANELAKMQQAAGEGAALQSELTRATGQVAAPTALPQGGSLWQNVTNDNLLPYAIGALILFALARN